MNQFIGLIEIESGETAVTDLAARCDDATLDELFTRLVNGDALECETDRSEAAFELNADLDLLQEDLARVTHGLLQECSRHRADGERQRKCRLGGFENL